MSIQFLSRNRMVASSYLPPAGHKKAAALIPQNRRRAN
jgi:hypothetical protein